MAKPGFAVLYRWRLKPGKEAQFVDAWSRVTQHYVRHRGGQGSRLHRGLDGVWYAYAQWPDAATRERAFAHDDQPEAHALMDDSIAERLSAIILEPVADFLVFSERG